MRFQPSFFRVRATNTAPYIADLPYWILLAGGGVLFESFRSVAHLAGRPFFLLSLVFFVVAAGLAYLRPRWRYVLIGFLVVTAPRAVALTMGGPSHHLLFPLLLGMATGLLARRTTSTSTAMVPGEASTGLWIFLFFFALCLVRARIDFYSPFVLSGYPLQDLEVAPEVSANFAFYLSTLLLLHLTGPLLFALCDRRFRADETDPLPVASHLIRGIAIGVAANVCVLALQFLDVDRVWIATARSREIGRLPGLFTDSGAAGVLLPLCCGSLYFFLRGRFVAPRWRWWAAFGVFLLAVIAGGFLGRGFWVAAAGTLCVALAIETRAWMSPGSFVKSGWSWKKWGLVLGALALFALVLTAGFRRSTPEYISDQEFTRQLHAFAEQAVQGQALLAYGSLGGTRAGQALAGFWIFEDFPVVGSGANSFMVEVRRFAWALPGLEIDNPGNFFSGLLSDFGLLGVLIFCTAAGAYLWDLRRRWREPERDPAALWIACLPLALLPTFVFGYHIVFAEFCAILLLPALLPAPGGPASGRSRLRSGFHGSLFLLALAYGGFWLGNLDLDAPPAYWRQERGVAPQLRPDRMADTEYVFYYRRNFATKAGADSVTFRIRTEPGSDPEYFCYGDGERFPLSREVAPAGPSGGGWRRIVVSLPPACRRRPNLEIQTARDASFSLRAADFQNGRLGSAGDEL